jgi:DNA-binding response OmpR family regulator
LIDEHDEREVALLWWPHEEARRRQLAARGEPRLLVISPGEQPPAEWDELEDWVREPIDAEELATRSRTLRERRAQVAGPLHLDDEGLVWLFQRWVALTETQLAMTKLLNRSAGSVVLRADLAAAYASAGGSTDRRAFDTAVRRLRAKLAELGVHLHALKGQRYLLEVPPHP